MSPRLKVLVVGNGGREDALAWKLSQSALVDALYVAPGNGSIRERVENVYIAVDDFPGLVKFSKEQSINLLVVGPEAPLVAGITDYFWDHAPHVRVFGPSKAAALLEGSKAFSKDFMKRHGIPTAAYESFSDYEAAKRYLDSVSHDLVIKADGLAAGKGVIIPQSKNEAHSALKEIMLDKQFGPAGDRVVIEEFLDGDELSILTFSDGHTFRSLPPAQDHKRIFDGDNGPNTGGMGCYAPTRILTPALMDQIDSTIIEPTIRAMTMERTPFIGMLFTGLMITKSGPKTLEYNVRGGDPETQTLLPLLEQTDLAQVMYDCTTGCLAASRLAVSPKSSTTVVAAAEGYPGTYAKNREITLAMPADDTFIFHAGTSRVDGKLLSAGGRVIAATATANTLEEAVSRAYEGMKCIRFEGMHYRKDIAHRAFRKSLVNGGTPLTYASAGVSIESGNELVESIKAATRSTARPGGAGEIGGFGGSFSLAEAGYHPTSPTIVAAIDGVGTKLKLAYAMDKHDTVGIDLVAMNVNDLYCQGAEALQFLDYYGTSKLDVQTAASFVRGVAKGCILGKCELAGGETAEMPGIYKGKEYDAAGCAIGAIDTGRGQKILPQKEEMKAGNVLLGLASDGVHSNGFSLVRKIIDRQGIAFTERAPWDPDKTVGLSLLTPTRIYSNLHTLTKQNMILGMAHITGGGLLENVPRMLPDNLAAEIDVSRWKRQEVFDWLQAAGKVESVEMSRTFNNGIGMVLCVEEAAVQQVTEQLEKAGDTVYNIGRVKARDGEGCVLKGLNVWTEGADASRSRLGR